MFKRPLAALAALCFSVAGAKAEPLDLTQPAPVQSPFLGLAFPGNMPELYGLLQDAGMSWARISASWGRIEPEQGTWDFSGLDMRVAGLQARGIHPFVTFESDADWATDPETYKVKNAAPLDITQWAQFVGAVVERYDGDGVDDMPDLRGPVRLWQAGNEFVSDTNASGGWAASTDGLIAYLNAAHDAVKAADPAARFVLGGTAALVMDVALVNQGLADWPVQQTQRNGSVLRFDVAKARSADVTAVVKGRLLRTYAEARYDLADLHLYGPEDRDPLRLGALRDLAGGRPILSSECGGPNLDYGGSYTDQAHFLSVVSRNLTLLGMGGQACLWFGLGEEMSTTPGNARVPLYDTDRAPKPGVYAYRLLARLLVKGAKVDIIPEGWKISAPSGQYVEVLRSADAGTGAITHCVLPEALDRVVPATDNVNCSNATLVFKGDTGTDILNKK